MVPGVFYITFLKLRQWSKMGGLGGRQSVYFLSQTIKETGLKTQNIDIEKKSIEQTFTCFDNIVSFINNRFTEIEGEMGRFLDIHLGLATDLQLFGFKVFGWGAVELQFDLRLRLFVARFDLSFFESIHGSSKSGVHKTWDILI